MTAISINRITSKTLRVALAGAVVLGSLAVLATRNAEASALTALTLTQSSTASGATNTTHTFKFTAQTSGTIKGVKLQYCTTASGTCTGPTGLSITAAAVGTVGAQDGTPSATTWTDAEPSANVLELSDATGYATSTDAAVQVAVSAIASNVGTTSDVTPTVFFVRVTTYSDAALTTAVDNGQVASAVIPTVTASGTQDAILEFTVSGVASAQVIAGATTTATSSATTLPFGNFKPVNTTGAASRVVAHTLTVVTNATTGYSASVVGDAGALTRVGGSETTGWVSNNTTWDEDTDGTGGDTGTTGLGITATGTEAATGFTGPEYEKADSSLAVATSAAPTAGNATSIVYRVQVSPTLAAGQYQGNIKYSVLPNY